MEELKEYFQGIYNYFTEPAIAHRRLQEDTESQDDQTETPAATNKTAALDDEDLGTLDNSIKYKALYPEPYMTPQ